MKNIYDLIVEIYKEGMKISLMRKDDFYTYIKTSNTKINGIVYERAIHYRISKANTKRISHLFIESTYNYYKNNNNTFPIRKWYETHEILKYEYKARPCNYSVAQSLIKKALMKL